MDDDAADGEEPNDYVDDFSEMGRICALFAVYRDSLEELEGYVKIEDRGNADWTEETDEDSLAFFFDLVDEFVHGENDWETSTKRVMRLALQ